VFRCLPAAAVVGDRIFCVHGGLSPYLDNLQEINQIIRPI
jgi:serine/threonine-protein phosphatase PP1 catalytic subunit